MSKRVTNLRAKNGAYFELDEEAKSIALVSTVRGVEPRLIDDTQFDQIDFDVVVPEYQVGDVVAVTKQNGKCSKGLILSTIIQGYEVAVIGNMTSVAINTETLESESGGWQIVGLWDEEKTQ